MSNPERQADELAVASLVHRERHWRDRGDWERMARAYAPDSYVRLGWFHGSGAEFVLASRASVRGGTTKHRLSPSIVEVHGDRALAETSTVVESRMTQDGVEVDLFAYCRYLTRARRDGGIWRLVGVDCIREKDTMCPVRPGAVLALDLARLATYRPSYRFGSYNLDSHGITPQPDLPGDDQPESVAPLYADAEKWLCGPNTLEET